MRLIYKTANEQPPLGLQNIYVSWCEGDDAALEKVISDIISSGRGSDCAVWYDYEPGSRNYDKERLKFILERMHIAVFVVTNRMLTQRSRSLDTEMEFIKDHSIAVLPIVMEETDVGEFYDRLPGVGDGVFRDAENYTERLKGALDYLLCDRELIEDIRKNAFCGRINIITNAKDRHHLAGMQKMIHDFEFCRDFAITCDDPFGIYQSQEIDMLRTIDQADVSLFTITPNVLHPTAPMATVLFPHIRDNGRPYIAIEAEETRQNKLTAIYKRIQEPIKLSEEQKLREKLGEMIGSKAVGRDTARHLFIVGMAYLYGIDAEVDIDRGVQLITAAAKQGLYEAQVKLVRMYGTGIGAPFDLESAVMWQTKIIEHETRIYNSKTSLENAARLAETINELGALYEKLDNRDKATNAYINAASLCERRLRNEANSGLIAQYAKSCESLGRLKEMKHNIKGAEDDFRKAFECYKKLLLGAPTHETMENIAEVSEHLGDICLARGKLDMAEEEYRRAYERRDYLASEAGQLSYRRMLAKCLDKMTELYLSVEDYERAEECALIACDITDKIKENCGTVNSMRGSGYTSARLSSVYRSMGKNEEAKQALRKAIDITEGAFKISSTDETAMDLISEYERLCSMLNNTVERKELLWDCDRILELRRELVEQQKNDERLQKQLAEACVKAADIHENGSDMRRLLEEAESIYENLFKRTGRSEYRELANQTLRHTPANRIVTERVKIRTRKKQQ